MSTFEDVSRLIFASSGGAQVVAMFRLQELAALRYEASVERLQHAGTDTGRLSAFAAVRSAQMNVERAAWSQVAAIAAGAIGFLQTEIHMVEEAVEKYADYAKQVRMVQALTGGTLRQSEQLTNLGVIAGVHPERMAKLTEHLARSQSTGQGQAALSQIGVSASPGNEIDTLQKVIVKLGQMRAGANRTALEMKIVGERGVESLESILMLQGDIIARSNALNANLDAGTMQSIAHLQQNLSLLGQTVLVELIVPLAQKLVPAIDAVVTKIQQVVDGFAKLDKMSHGIAGYSAIFLAIAGAIGVATVASGALAAAYTVLIGQQGIQVTLAGALDALTGNWVAIAAGAAIVTGGVIGFNALNSGQGAAPQNQAATNRFADAADKFAKAVGQMTRGWNDVAGGGLPSNMTAADYAQLSAQRAAGLIG